MDAKKKLIVGLGELFKDSDKDNAITPVMQNGSYAAVRICSSANTSSLQEGTFLFQPHCVDMRRTLLKQLLPFLDKQPSSSSCNHFSDVNVSRRYSRLLFSQHQDWVWSSVATSLRETAIEPESIVLLVDMSDCFANAVWIDCLFGLRERYAQAQFYPVFFLPQMENLTAEQAAVIGAAVTELSQLSQGKWTPSDISSGENYCNKTPLWDVAYLQEGPTEQNAVAVLQLVEALLTLSNVEHNDYGTLRQSLSQEYHKIFQAATAKSAQLLPRFASILGICLDLDVKTLEEVLVQQCQSKLLASLSHAGSNQQTYGLEELDHLGCVLHETHLHLNTNSCGVNIGNWLSVEDEWHQYKQALLSQLEKRSQDSWHDQAEFIAGNLRAYYDKKFREKGVEKYYEHPDARLNKMSKSYVAVIERHFWKSWKNGHSSLSALQEAIEGLIIHYVQKHQEYLLEQEQSIDQVKASAAWWESISGQWQRANASERAQIEAQYPIEDVAARMEFLFVKRCHYKANVFAERLILSMQPYLLHLQQQLFNATDVCVSDATQMQKSLNATLDNLQNAWFERDGETTHSRYLLQPNKASLQLFADAMREKMDEAAEHLLQLCTASLDDKDNFNVLLNLIDQANWQEEVKAMSRHTVRGILQQEHELLDKALERRITELEQEQVQHLGQLSLSNLVTQYRSLIQPLGDMLTTQYSTNESACLLCEDKIQKHELVSTWLAQCVQQSLPKAKVMSLHGERSLQFVYASTCYLDEWVELADFLNAYRQFKYDEEALLHLHIDGSNEAIETMQKNSINRNRELIRQHLLLALITGRLQESTNEFVLTFDTTDTALHFETTDLADVVDYISFEHIKQLVDLNEQQRAQKFFSEQAPTLLPKLDEVLNVIKEANLPEGVDLEDADWSDAGRYVVWSRAAHYLRKQWLKNSTSGKRQRVA